DIAATTNTGWRTISDSGRPPCGWSPGTGFGSSTRDCTKSAAIAMSESIANEHRKGIANQLQATRESSGPMTPPTMPPASTSEIAFALNTGGEISAAANRYWAPKAV